MGDRKGGVGHVFVGCVVMWFGENVSMGVGEGFYSCCSDEVEGRWAVSQAMVWLRELCVR